MNRSHWLGLVCLCMASATALLGCNQRPVVPTVAVEPTEPVVVIVITATSQPTLAPTNTAEPTITPIPTFTPIVTETITPTKTAKATRVAQATRPPATVAAAATTLPTESAPPTPAPSTSFAAPAVFAPEGKAFRDGDTIKFEFGSVGPLAPDQCYRVDMTLGNPNGPGGVGDWWVPMNLCGNQANIGDHIVFELKPGRFRDAPNYGTLLIDADNVVPPSPDYVMRWFASIVKLVDTNDPVHPNVQALSPSSASLQNTVIR